MTLEFLEVEDVVDLHREQIERFGGTEGLRDAGLLESAVMQPQATFGGEYLHEDVFHMAAAYAFHIAENQPFLDGNKRTAVYAALTFLTLNGVAVLDSDQSLYNVMLDVAARKATKDGSADLLRRLARQTPP